VFIYAKNIVAEAKQIIDKENPIAVYRGCNKFELDNGKHKC
jgi:hypothetical protein